MGASQTPGTAGRSTPDTPRGAAGLVRGPWVVLIAVLLLVVTLAVAAYARNGPAVPQPIQFNHRRHTADLGLACEFCHVHVTTGAHAGLPDASTCSMCHAAPQGTSAEAARVTELLAEGSPLRFNKLFRMPDHVFYTHRRHVGIAELPCEGCHGAIADTQRPPERALMRIDMDFCMDCHREAGASLDCNACHR